MSLTACVTGPQPFDREVNSRAMIKSALTDLDENKKLLLTFGANWCSDSRKLAAVYQQEPLATLVGDQYEVVFVDVGKRDHNMQLAEYYKVPVMGGIPAVAVVNKNGELEFSSQATDLNNAEKMTETEIFAYFQKITN